MRHLAQSFLFSQLRLDDPNVLSVLRYAVHYLGVEHGALFLF